MSTTYTLCKRMIELGLTGGLQEKLDTFYAMDRLSMEEYTGLSAALEGQNAACGESPAL